MNAQIIFGSAVIFAALGISSWQWFGWTREQGFQKGRIVAVVLFWWLIYYVLVWFAWSVVAMLAVLADIHLITDQRINWLFMALLAPWSWLTGLF